MNKLLKHSSCIRNIERAVGVVALQFLPAVAMASDSINVSLWRCHFLGNVDVVLKIMSIGVLVAAVLVACYQILFKKKRFLDIGPLLIGALLIAGAAQFAKLLVPNMTDECLGGLGLMLQTAQVMYA